MSTLKPPLRVQSLAARRVRSASLTLSHLGLKPPPSPHQALSGCTFGVVPSLGSLGLSSFLFFLFRTPLPWLELCLHNFSILRIHILFWNLELCSWFKREV